MAMEENEAVAPHSPWKRLLYIVLFAAIFQILEIVLGLTLVVQFIFHLFTREPHAALTRLGLLLGEYAFEIITFLTYGQDRVPYPFGPAPSASLEEKEAPAGKSGGSPRRRSRKSGGQGS